MKRAIAIAGIIAAVTFVVYSAVTLYWTAYNQTTLDWQKQLYGFAAAAVVLFEALGIIFAVTLWREKQRGIALSCLILLAAATAWTFRLELINQVHGSADRFAARAGTISQSQNDAAQLAVLSRQQARWTTIVENSRGKTLADVRAELDKVNAQVSAIIDRQNSRPAVTEVAPDASLAARLLGGNEVQWRDWLAILTLLFWPLSRIIAPAVAVAFWMIAWARETIGEALHIAVAEPEQVEGPLPSQLEQVAEQKRKWDANDFVDEPQEKKPQSKQFPAKCSKKSATRALLAEIAEEFRAARGDGKVINAREVEDRVKARFGAAGVPAPRPESRGKAFTKLGLKPRDGSREYFIEPRKEVGQFVRV